MIAYDVVGLFNLTVFEIVAFTLVFAWLIALVATTAGPPSVVVAARPRRHLARRRLGTGEPAEPRRGRRLRSPAGPVYAHRPRRLGRCDGAGAAPHATRRSARATSSVRCGLEADTPTTRQTPPCAT